MSRTHSRVRVAVSSGASTPSRGASSSRIDCACSRSGTPSSRRGFCGHHLHTPPTPPSVRLGRALDPTLEAVVLECLAKAPGERPRNAMALHDALAVSAAANDWTAEHARAWWEQHRPPSPSTGPTPDPNAETIAVDLGSRS